MLLIIIGHHLLAVKTNSLQHTIKHKVSAYKSDIIQVDEAVVARVVGLEGEY
jgi:hypothetical protein